MIINQGGNAPIYLDFEEVYNRIEVSLHLPAKGAEIKHWSITDNDKKELELEIKESESVKFPSGKAILSVKCLDDSGNVLFFDDVKVDIIYHNDKSIMGE